MRTQLMNNNAMLGTLIKDKMVDYEKGRNFTVSDEFYKLSIERQDALINQNRVLKQEIDELRNKIDSLSIENTKLTREIEDIYHDGSLWLSDVIAIESPEFGSNNLIISPVGSGKTHTITEVLSPLGGAGQLLLVSTSSLKTSVMEDGMFTTQSMKTANDGDIWVMTYAEFGKRIKINDDFIYDNNITDIYCDEIHSLIEYKSMFGSDTLSTAMRFLLQKTMGVTKYYFTATAHNLDKISKQWFAEVSKFDYTNYPDIRKYTASSELTFSHVDQLRGVLRNFDDFKNYGKKGMFFSNKITTLNNFAEQLIEEGFSPLVLWSVNNQDNEMTDSQLEAYNELLTTGEIPAGYNFLLINSAMREGWNLLDKKVDLVIINSTNETDLIQARGRVRKNVSTLITRVYDSLDVTINIPEEYLDINLTKDIKDSLISELNLINEKGRLSGWTIIRQLLEATGYTVVDSTKRIDGKRTRVSTITKM